MNKSAFIKSCAAALAAQGFVSAKARDVSREYTWVVEYNEAAQLKWAADYLKSMASQLVPNGMAELRVRSPNDYGRHKAAAIYWCPLKSFQCDVSVRHDPPKAHEFGGHLLMERFRVE